MFVSSVNRIVVQAEHLRSLSNAELLDRSQVATIARLQESAGKHRRGLRNEVFALSIEAIRRETGKLLRPVQIIGAIGLSRRKIIEMQTGEGKTLTGVPAVAYLASRKRGCHVVTSNGYLASRDAEMLGPIYKRLGLSVACVTADSDQDQRRAAYQADITFGTASEFGFDFLRDCLFNGPKHASLTSDDRDRSGRVHRGFYAAVVDEADSVLIDEASTPLIIGAEVKASEAYKLMYTWADECASGLDSANDFVLEPVKLTAHLTDYGARKVVLASRPPILDSICSEEILEQVERAVVARHILGAGRDYLVDDGELVLISGSTGRRLDGRKWQRGLHQAVEAKERIEISEETRTTARITIQEYFNLYDHLSGMTGTARSAKSELRRFYRLGVRTIPTNKPCRRIHWKPKIYPTLRDKHEAIASEVGKLQKSGRPVLIGTPSVEASESLATYLRDAGVNFQLLNANQDELESEIISAAGQVGCVTIATNMAGRGTDIELAGEVQAAGGLHVIATEIHSSLRIDRQLEGRCGRQGDPGSYQLMVSLEDELWLAAGGFRRSPLSVLIGSRSVTIRHFRQLQRRLQRASSKSRLRMFKSSRQHRKRLLDAGFDLYLELNEN